MSFRGALGCAVLCVLAGCRENPGPASGEPSPPADEARAFAVRGVVKELRLDQSTIVIQHEAIPGYMAAMTMPFKTRAPEALAGLVAGDGVTFRLRVTAHESWIDNLTKTGATVPIATRTEAHVTNAPPPDHHPLLDYAFTNELGETVSLSQFRGRALAMTFFFTRCPIPDYCPRLSRNFQAASQKLAAMPGAPTNWHFLSVTFDTEFDTPAVLQAYGKRYGYDPRHWSFLTGSADKIGELVRLSGGTFERQGPSFDHDFRTLIIDPSGELHMSFPIGGDLSEAIVEEIVKAASTATAILAP